MAMRLVKPNSVRRQAFVGQDAFDQLRDLGGRLEYIVGRYSRLVADVSDGRPLPDMRDSVELMGNQLAYVAKRLQELLLGEYEQRHAQDDPVEMFAGEAAVASR
jgi:hypothetical protein